MNDDALFSQLVDLSPKELEYRLDGMDEDQKAIVKAGVATSKARQSPLDFMEVIGGGDLKRAPHLELLNKVLVDACHNQRNIIVSLSVRHGKSFLCSEHFPAWFLGRFPDKKIIQCSYNKEAATTFSRKARDIFIDNSQQVFNGLKLKNNSQAANRWDVEGHSGGLFATGPGSTIIGFGGDIIICDDMYKDSIQAYSKAYDKELKTWWTDTLLSRQEPGASIIVVLARWHDNDLAGWLTHQSKTIEGYSDWIEIKIPAIAMDDDVLGRDPGEALWPWRFPVEELNSRKANTSDITWWSQWQQHPKSVSDTMFPVDSWNIATGDELKALHRGGKLNFIRFWDLSAGGKNADYLAGVLMAMDRNGLVYVVDVIRKKIVGENSDLKVQEIVRTTAEQDEENYGRVQIKLEQTAGAGKAVAEDFVRSVLAGHEAEALTKKGDKVSNAGRLAAQQQAQNVHIVLWPKMNGEWGEPGWFQDFRDELLYFPNYNNDDQVDAASHCYLELAKMHKKKGKATISVAKKGRSQVDARAILSNDNAATAKRGEPTSSSPYRRGKLYKGARIKDSSLTY